MSTADISFEWDREKDRINQAKHSVSFGEAQYAFMDSKRVIAVDHKHSTKRETRYFCFGMVHGRVLTVRFTYREGKIRVFGAGYWREGKENMKKQTGYCRAPKAIGEAIKEAEIIKDFLPDPDELVMREDIVKVTLNLSRDSVEFLKKKAQEKGVSYQHMIKKILDVYTEHFQEPKSHQGKQI